MNENKPLIPSFSLNLATHQRTISFRTSTKLSLALKAYDDQIDLLAGFLNLHSNKKRFIELN